jgi:hypothetical protein
MWNVSQGGQIVVCTDNGEIVVCENSGQFKAFILDSPMGNSIEGVL